MSCTLYALLKHPDVLKKAYEEVDRVLGPDTDARPTYQQVTQLTYITQILKEALRLWPPAPAYGIAPLKDETIGGKYKLKKNTFVTVLVMALHRDPSVWGPNPDAFDPENFSREAEAKRPVNAWKPFGNGQRACIGRGFAMHEAALAIGMILQRFKLIDIHRYQMQLKETLTIKPDGFKIKVRPRDRERARRLRRPRCGGGRSLEHGGSRRRGRAPATTRRCWCSTAPTSAPRKSSPPASPISPRSMASRPKLAPMDEFVGKLPEQGGVLIFCASYNGAAPDNATQFVKWLGSDLPKDAFANVRYAVFGCGNSDWAATYQSVPRMIDEQLAAHGGRSVYARGEGDARSDLDGQFEKWFAAAAARGHQGIRPRIEHHAQRRRRAALHDRAGGADRGQHHRGAGRRLADEGAGQFRAAEQVRRQSVRPLDPAYRGATAAGRFVSRRRSPQRGAAQRSGAGRFGCAPVRLPAGRPDQACRSPKAAARNCRSEIPCRSGGC